MVNTRRWAARFEYGIYAYPAPRAAWVAHLTRAWALGVDAAAGDAAAARPGASSTGRHTRTDKQQKNAILNDAGGIVTLEAVERRVYRRHGEDDRGSDGWQTAGRGV